MLDVTDSFAVACGIDIAGCRSEIARITTQMQAILGEPNPSNESEGRLVDLSILRGNYRRRIAWLDNLARLSARPRS